MPRTFPIVALVLMAGVQDVRADFGSVFVQAHGGYGGGDTEELMPGGADPALGPALGLQAGARLLFLEGYVDHTEMIRTGAIQRAVLGVHGGVSVWRTRLTLRAGIGAISEEDGALSGVEAPGEDRVGGLARLGGSIDREVTKRLYLGGGMDGEVYALEGDRQGFDVMANVRLSFELGI